MGGWGWGRTHYSLKVLGWGRAGSMAGSAVGGGGSCLVGMLKEKPVSVCTPKFSCNVCY